jgi:hypothetical protein
MRGGQVASFAMELQAARASGDTRRMEQLFATFKGDDYVAAAATTTPRPAPATNTVGVQVTEMCDTSTQVEMDSEEARWQHMGGRGSVPAAATVREDDVHATRRAMMSGLVADGLVPARSVLQVSVSPGNPCTRGHGNRSYHVQQLQP